MQRHYALALVFALLTQILFFVWLAVPALNSQYVYGYPRIGSNPGPGTFVDTRTSVFAIVVGLLIINVLPPILLMTAVQLNDVSEIGAIHSIISGTCVFINIGVFLFVGITWFATCNNGLGIWNTACHDPRYCCPNYAINPSALLLCPNNAGCYPRVEYRDLTASGAYKGHFWFSLVFALTAWWHVATNQRLVIYGVLQT